MAGEDNLIPFHERTEDEQREIRRKGGIASGKARKRKSDIRKALEAILTLDAPNQSTKELLLGFGLDPSMENALVLNTVLASISEGDPKHLETIARLIGQTATLADIREQKARIDRLKAETERTKHDIAVKTGAVGKEEAEAQTIAIADLINSPEEPRKLTDFMYDEQGESLEIV